jgi:hypothetical protein
MKSIAISLHPLAAALAKAKHITKPWLGSKSEYKPKNAKQKVFLKYYDQLVSDAEKITEMKSIAHTDPDAVSKFIETGKGSGAKISKDDIEFTVGSVFEIFLKWIKPGEKDTMKFEGKSVQCSVMKNILHKKGILCIHAKNGDLVFMKIGEAKNSFELFETVLALADTVRKNKEPETVEAHFPFIKLRTSDSYKWLKGLDLDADAKHSHPGYTVIDASAKNELDVDHEGARIKSSSQVTCVMKGFTPKPKIVKIDKPFLFWVMRPGCDLPIFAACCNSDVLIK